jgi:predicted ATP-grasp superfamily ATP-dependent carboligase
VIGLTSHKGIYGNFTRYAEVRHCPDSREQPDALLAFLLRLGDEIEGGVIFPTRDDDVLFLERFRQQLERRFILALPQSSALQASLDKWETYQWARKAGVPTPGCWVVSSKEELQRIAPELPLPCVLKPISAHLWRKGANWRIVGSRKAIPVTSKEELLAEYDTIAQADGRVLVQEMVSGSEDCLRIAACYMDRDSNFVAGFTAQKLLQVPVGFGTGCIVQAQDFPELRPIAVALLQAIRFTGIAEVEFKWDSRSGEYKLIEINPRPWDQHRLGSACGVDLIHIAYCSYVGLPLPSVSKQSSGAKWIAEDTFLMRLLKSCWRRDGQLRPLLRLASGKRIYGIWAAADPLPLFAFVALRFGPDLFTSVVRYLGSMAGRLIGRRIAGKKGLLYENYFQKPNCKP